MIRYYIKPVEESLEECIATYGDNVHQTLEEAWKCFEKHKDELGDAVIIKVTMTVEEVCSCEN